MLRKRSERYKRGLFIIEGLRAVTQVIQNNLLQIEDVIVDENVFHNQNLHDEFKLLLGGSLPLSMIHSVSSTLFDELSDTENAQGVMAVASMPDTSASHDMLEKQGIILAADRIQDPGNLGTMIRSAVWFGACGLVMAPGTVDLFNPKVVRGTAGATGVLPWLETKLTAFFKEAIQSGWTIHIMDGGADARSWKRVSATGKDILVAGNEAGGVSEELSAFSQREGHCQKVRIDAPERPASEISGKKSAGVESLNVAVAAGILLARMSREE